MNNVVIIPAAGKPKLSFLPNTYDPMIPINGIPAIKYIIKNYFKQGVTKFIVIIYYKDIQTFNLLSFLNNNFDYNIIIIKIREDKGPGNSILLGIEHLENEDKVIVNLGDTIISNNILPYYNTILVSNNNKLEPKNWCFVKKENKNLIFHDKPLKYQGGRVICGYYEFSNIGYLKELAVKLKEIEHMEIKEILMEYSKVENFKLIEEKNSWFDLGHLEGYYKAKFKFLRTRSFNRLKYNSFKGIIKKKSNNIEKIFCEFNWFLNLPDDLKIFTPRLVDFNYDPKNTYYSIEFYGYPSLADLFLYADLSIEHWKQILKRLMKFYLQVKEKYQIHLPFKDYYAIYVNKTKKRVETLLKDDYFNKLWEKKKLIINGEEFQNISTFFSDEYLKKKLKNLFNDSNDSTIIHGDFCFSNILYDINSGLFKMIDPRGKFATISIYGDIKYDLGKLRHSIHGYYEAIISDLFILRESHGSFEYKFYNNKHLTSYFDSMLTQYGFDPKKIVYIEGLLYLTMIPLHNDSRKRQKLMYLRAVELLNQFEDKK